MKSATIDSGTISGALNTFLLKLGVNISMLSP